MKYLFVGLGNIGAKYQSTRHNVGFDIADMIADEFGAKFYTSRLADVTDFRYKGKSIYIIKPATYMNLSGRAFRYYLSDLNIPVERSLTFVDDIALPFGKIRLKNRGSHGGHNGLKNIQEELNTDKYPRLRFGIGDDFSKGKQIGYVLGEWSKQQKEELASYIHSAKQAALSFVHAGMANTMNEFN